MVDFGNIVLGSMNPMEEVVVKKLFTFSIWGKEIVVSNHMFMITLAAIVLLIFLPMAVRKKGLVRSGFGNLIESICVFVREEVARPFLGDSTDRYIGFVWTVFYFVLTLNLLGMVPMGKFITLVTGKVSHLEGAATANIWVVGALAIVAFFMIHIAGAMQQGFWGYIKNFAPKVPWPMVPFIYLLEIIGAIVRPFSLAIRLFANMLAGHIVLATIVGFMFIFKSYFAAGPVIIAVVIMSLLEIFVAFLQAYVFTLLSTIFIGFAVQTEH